MAGSQKKTAKGRLDKFYKLAKEQGYRSRAAFKLIQLNKKYSFLEKSKVVIDLCAAPGGWLQVASKHCKPGALIIGVDLVPIRPIPNCITFAEDINSDKCRAQLRQHMKTWKADCVIHDGAPNVGTAWLQDAYSQAELVLMSLKLACEFLITGGTFVTKVFRSKDYNSLLYTFNQLFTKVEATKPQASRNVSAEIFVVCRGFKAPLKLDPKLLDPKSVFEDLPDVPQNQEAKVFHPERRKRQREGYEEGNYTQHNVKPISEFVLAQDPIQVLGLTHEFSFSGEEDQKFKKMDITTTEIRACCADLQVLGKKDFRSLLRWRTAVREAIGLGKRPEDDEAVVAVEPLDEDEQIDQDIEKLNEAQKAKIRREKRRANEKKLKEITRMQMGMTSAMEIGTEQAGQGEDAMFALKDLEKKSALGTISRGTEAEDEVQSESEEDEEIELEDQLDVLYDQYRERKANSDAKFKAKRARKDKEDDEWHGLDDEMTSAEKEADDDDSRNAPVDIDSDSDDSDEEEEADDLKLTTTLEKEETSATPGLTKRVALFFAQNLFEGLESSSTEAELDSKASSSEDINPAADEKSPKKAQSIEAKGRQKAKPEKEKKKKIKESAFEEVPRAEYSDVDSDEDVPGNKGRSSVDIVTAEAMTLAHQIASKEKSKSDLIDDGYNKFAFYEKDGAPEWFLDDENVHNKPNLPITKAASDALRDKMRAMNARPIKKILEAKGRKKQRALRVLGKINQKANVINETEDLTERQKAQSITRLLNRASKSKPKNKVSVVVASGKNKGQGRPQGTKGPYKMVDARLKKETRALKRVARKAKGRR